MRSGDIELEMKRGERCDRLSLLASSFHFLTNLLHAYREFRFGVSKLDMRSMKKLCDWTQFLSILEVFGSST